MLLCVGCVGCLVVTVVAEFGFVIYSIAIIRSAFYVVLPIHVEILNRFLVALIYHTIGILLYHFQLKILSIYFIHSILSETQ